MSRDFVKATTVGVYRDPLSSHSSYKIGELLWGDGVELHPAHMAEDDLKALKAAGVTLLSVGVESATDKLLQRIGRTHTAEAALQALERAPA